MSTFLVLIAPAFRREIKKLDKAIQKKVVKTLEALGENPRPAGVEKLEENPKFWRVKVGDFRVIYNVNDKDKTVTAVLIRHRKDAYRNLDKLDARLLAVTIAPLLSGLAAHQ